MTTGRLLGLWTSLVLAMPVAAEDIPAPLFIEGYTGQVSYAPGEELTLHVSTSEELFAASITRLGSEPNMVWDEEDLPGGTRDIPEDASSHGCRWPVSVTLPIPADWKSGYYRVVLRTGDRGEKFVRRASRSARATCFFVLREAPDIEDPAPILLQLATNTYNAYNNWGGFSLYAYHSRGGNAGHRVSFHRPPVSQFERWEKVFVEWAEREGIPLAYAANSDLEFHKEVLENRRLVLSVGHDEYWSAPMRDHLRAFIDAGGNAAFFSGNTCCWQVRSEDEGSALTCWKQNFQLDPVFAARESYATLSTLWSHHLVGRPENELTGVGFLWGGYHRSHGQVMDGDGAFTAHRPDHWIFEGTNLKRGESFGAEHTVVGYECDG
ncbi:MAG: hypothetical protein HKO57_12970, partial [Akkermansiaceae bacterium]|nr:hypothetical protein [Akkermansiaceae bacterium]